MKTFLLLTLGLLTFAVAAPARDKIDYLVVAEQTERGVTFARVSADQPVTYVARDGGYIEAGDAVAGERPPTADAVARVLASALDAQGYRPATDAAGARLLITYHWGVIRPINVPVTRAYNNFQLRPIGRLSDTPSLEHDLTLKARIALVAPNKVARETQDRFVGINHIPTGIYVTQAMRDALQLALDSRYFLILTAYDYAAAARGENALLWRVRLSADDNVSEMNRAVLALAAASGPYLGRTLARAEFGQAPFVATPAATSLAPAASVAPETPEARAFVDKLLAHEHAFFSGYPGADEDEFQPARPTRAAKLPAELTKRVASYQQEKTALQQELAARIKSATPGADTRRTIDAFNAENANRIAALGRTREALRDDLARFAAARGGATSDKSLDALLQEFAADARDLTTPVAAQP